MATKKSAQPACHAEPDRGVLNSRLANPEALESENLKPEHLKPEYLKPEYLKPEYLKLGSIFGALSTASIEFLLQRGTVIELRQNDLLFDYGDPGSSFFVVCSGAIDIYKQHGSYTRQNRTATFGQEVGFAAMIALNAHAGAAIAQQDSVVLEITSELFARFHEEFPLDFGVLLINLTRDLARLVRKLGNALAEQGAGETGRA